MAPHSSAVPAAKRSGDARRDTVPSHGQERGITVRATSDDAVTAGCRTQMSTFIDGRSVFQKGSVTELRGSFHAHGSCPSNCATIALASAVISGVGWTVTGG